MKRVRHKQDSTLVSSKHNGTTPMTRLRAVVSRIDEKNTKYEPPKNIKCETLKNTKYHLKNTKCESSKNTKYEPSKNTIYDHSKKTHKWDPPKNASTFPKKKLQTGILHQQKFLSKPNERRKVENSQEILKGRKRKRDEENIQKKKFLENEDRKYSNNTRRVKREQKTNQLKTRKKKKMKVEDNFAKSNLRNKICYYGPDGKTIFPSLHSIRQYLEKDILFSNSEEQSSSSLLSPEDLEINLKEEERIAGNLWIGRKVECYWAYPVKQRGFYTGEIINFRRLDGDTEYLIHYEGDSFSWEGIDDGIRFVDPQHELEKQCVTELRKQRGKCSDWGVGFLSRIQENMHTRIGNQYQVDLKSSILDQSDEVGKEGTLLWNPSVIPSSSVDKYLEATETIIPDSCRGKEISFVEDNSTTTLEQAFQVLHRNNYNIGASIKEMKKEGKYWCFKKPDLTKHWTNLEVVSFELGMKIDPKNFTEIQRKIPTKTKREIIHFFWYWRTTNNYKDWKKQDKFLGLEVTKINKLLHDVPIKDYDQNRNPRLRKRPRVDYSYSTLKSKFKESTLPKCVSSRKKESEEDTGSEEEEIHMMGVYDIGIYAGLYFPSEDKEDCEYINGSVSSDVSSNESESSSKEDSESEFSEE